MELSRENLFNYSKREIIEIFLEYFAQKTDSSLNIAMLRDLIERFHRMNIKLEESEELYRSILTAMSEGIVIQDRSGQIITANESAEKILGLTIDQMAGRTSIDPRWKAIHEDGSVFPGSEHPAMVTMRTGRPLQNVIMGVHKATGELSWISINSQPIFGHEGNDPAMVVTTFVDITERRMWEEELKRISVTDHLTQVFNRVKLTETLREEMKRAERYQIPLSLIMFDIDHFKNINDGYGHDAGDYVLVEIVRLVQQMVRDTDVMARWGGEEFMLVLPSTESEDAFCLAERIRKRIEENAFETVGNVTASFGITEYVPSDSEDELMKRLDDALYKAKRSGRNRVEAL